MFISPIAVQNEPLLRASGSKLRFLRPLVHGRALPMRKLSNVPLLAVTTSDVVCVLGVVEKAWSMYVT